MTWGSFRGLREVMVIVNLIQDVIEALEIVLGHGQRDLGRLHSGTHLVGAVSHALVKLRRLHCAARILGWYSLWLTLRQTVNAQLRFLKVLVSLVIKVEISLLNFLELLLCWLSLPKVFEATLLSRLT